MKKNLSRHMLMAIVALSAAVALPSLATAKVSGACGDCHTMHNSQDGSAMASDGAFGTTEAGTAERGVLLRYGCVGCHTGTNSGGDVPFVLSTAPTYGTDTLAGGNFKWANDDDSYGHNVSGANTADAALGNTPPGGTELASQLTCAGTIGCHGDRTEADQFGAVAGGHHGSGGDTTTLTGYTITSGHSTDMSDAFRMLAGIKGIEENGWEYAPTATKHNQYFGVDRTADTDTADGSISALCAQCHGEFHNGSGNVSTTFGSPWVRHPTDFDMAKAGGEYAFFNGGTDGETADYSPETPLASDQQAAVLATVNVGTTSADDSAIVTCLSCHRAHGSPYADLLRWNYADMDAHAGTSVGTGCFRCHTTKDDA